MGRERVEGGKSKAVSSHRSPRNQDPESHAKTRSRERVGINKGVMECSGLTELGMGRERVEGENPKRCQATAVQETRIRNLTRRREGAKGLG
jgi:hypothetical protein